MEFVLNPQLKNKLLYTNYNVYTSFRVVAINFIVAMNNGCIYGMKLLLTIILAYMTSFILKTSHHQWDNENDNELVAIDQSSFINFFTQSTHGCLYLICH